MEKLYEFIMSETVVQFCNFRFNIPWALPSEKVENYTMQNLAWNSDFDPDICGSAKRSR